MYLGQMKETVEMFAIAISKALNVEVMIVDKDLNMVGNTWKYSEKPIEVRRMSIIGKVISSGELLTIDDRTNYYVCKNCPDIKSCDITGFIGVPINFHNEVIGAIALIVPNRNTSSLYKNFRNSKDFLEKMADLLASKVQNIYDYNNLNLIKKEREIIMDSMDDAIFLINELGQITYYNKKFIKYFHVETDLIGMNFLEFINNPIMKECFNKRSDVLNKLMYAEYKQRVFYLLLSATSIMLGGAFKGMLFIFKSLGRFNHALNNMTNKTKTTFAKFSQTSSNKLKNTLNNAKKLAVTDKIILIQSEGNCGEELLAQSIHNYSSRSQNCLLKIECSYHPVNVLEKEIFGYQNSADMSERMGKIMLSHNGTLYFHEINELSLYLQKRITSFIKNKTITKSNTIDTSINTRMIFFTSKPLAKLVELGEFDEELYYWIGANALYLPSLKERKEDLPMLIKQNIKYFSKQFNFDVPELDSELMSKLCRYDWTDNLKELEKVTEKIVYFSKGKTVSISDLPNLSLNFCNNEVISMEDVEREHIASMLESNKSKEEISRLLNISRGTLYRKIKKYNL